MTLEAAIRNADLASALDLIRAGVDVNRRGADGLTPLMVASGLGQSQMVGILLAAGADVLSIDPQMGATALHKAAQSGNPDVIDLLLGHGAFIDQQSPILGHTALMDAVLHKNAAAARILLDRGARTNIQNHWQQTALVLARNDQLTDMVELIEDRDKKDAIQVNSLTLIAATKAGDLDAVKRLTASGANVNERMPIIGSLDDNYTPLGVAAREGHAAIVEVLLNAGADPRRTIGLMKGTPVHEAAFFGRADIIRLFASLPEQAGRSAIELDAQGLYNGLTPLHDAVWHGHREAAQELVEAGAPLHLRSHAGLTAREMATLYGYDDLGQFLEQAAQRQGGDQSAA